MTTGSSKEQSLTERLNETGYPFQEWCLSVIKSTKATESTIRELPYTFPETRGSQIGVSGEIDILSLRIPPRDLFQRRTPYLLFVIECKRANPKIKTWCFMNTAGGHFDSLSLLIRSSKNISPSFFTTETKEISSLGITLQDSAVISEDDVVQYGFETNERVSTINRNKDDRLYLAMLQCVRGVGHMGSIQPLFIDRLGLDEEAIRRAQTVVNPPIPFQVFIVPVVVTTAELWVVRIAAEATDGLGNIPAEHAKWEKRDWVVYDFGLPDYLQYAGPVSSPVFVVSAAFFSEFYKNFTPKIYY